MDKLWKKQLADGHYLGFQLLVLVLYGLSGLSACTSSGVSSEPVVSFSPNRPSRGTARDSAQKTVGPQYGCYKQLIEKLTPLHKELGPPQVGDWLEAHHEQTQNFERYVSNRPIRVTNTRNKIYILPVGKFTETQRDIVVKTAHFMSIYFGLEVRIMRDYPISPKWPKEAIRKHADWGDTQLLSTYILDDVLRPQLPDDAATLLAFTAMDLWPGRGWNFVFGQASLKKRVGVWSLYRNGDPDASKKSYTTCLKRTLKTATHETGHMFSMGHCTQYECNMCGANSLPEADRHPAYLCPVCLAKLKYATGVEIKARYKKLTDFAKQNGLVDEALFYQKSLDALMDNESTDCRGH